MLLLLACVMNDHTKAVCSGGCPDSDAPDSDSTALRDTDSADRDSDSANDSAPEVVYSGVPDTSIAYAHWGDVEGGRWPSAGRALDLTGDGLEDFPTEENAGARVNVNSPTELGDRTATDSAVGVIGAWTYPQSVASRDATGDGLPDLVVGDGGWDPEYYPAGDVYLMPGALSGESSVDDARWGMELDDGTALGSLAAVDRDGDGVDEVYVCGTDPRGSGDGVVYGFVTVQGARVYTADADTVIQGDFGRVLPAGDLTGDGLDDLIVDTQSYGFSVVSVQGSGEASDLAGASVDLAGGWADQGDASGDVDGDGIVDFVGVFGIDDTSRAVGLWPGPLVGALSTADATWQMPGETLAGSPRRVRQAGDQDGDGLGDLLVAFPYVQTINGEAGSLLMAFGPFDDGSRAPLGPRIFGAPGETYLGTLGPMLGPDIDGDGARDVAADAYWDSDFRIDLLPSSAWVGGEWQ